MKKIRKNGIGMLLLRIEDLLCRYNLDDISIRTKQSSLADWITDPVNDYYEKHGMRAEFDSDEWAFRFILPEDDIGYPVLHLRLFDRDIFFSYRNREGEDITGPIRPDLTGAMEFFDGYDTLTKNYIFDERQLPGHYYAWADYCRHGAILYPFAYEAVINDHDNKRIHLSLREKIRGLIDQTKEMVSKKNDTARRILVGGMRNDSWSAIKETQYMLSPITSTKIPIAGRSATMEYATIFPKWLNSFWDETGKVIFSDFHDHYYAEAEKELERIRNTIRAGSPDPEKVHDIIRYSIANWRYTDSDFSVPYIKMSGIRKAGDARVLYFEFADPAKPSYLIGVNKDTWESVFFQYRKTHRFLKSVKLEDIDPAMKFTLHRLIEAKEKGEYV